MAWILFPPPLSGLMCLLHGSSICRLRSSAALATQQNRTALGYQVHPWSTHSQGLSQSLSRKALVTWASLVQSPVAQTMADARSQAGLQEFHGDYRAKITSPRWSWTRGPSPSPMIPRMQNSQHSEAVSKFRRS